MPKESVFKFLGYRVSKVNLMIEEDYNPNVSKRINVKTYQNFDKNNSNFVEVGIYLTLDTENEKNFFFEIDVKGGFERTDDIEDELFKKLYTQNAPAILFPFVRAIVSTYTAQANIPPILLPSMNFTNDS